MTQRPCRPIVNTIDQSKKEWGMASILCQDSYYFPPVEESDENGLVAIGGDLSPERLLVAYTNGIFPWFGEEQPVLWWSPDPRCVLFLTNLHIPRSLLRVMHSGRFQITCNMAFEQVIRACARSPRPGQDGTWIVPPMQQAYITLYNLGLAHSVEAWQDGVLVGGLYGVSLGKVFFGESMFYEVPDASKVAFASYALYLKEHGFAGVDCQQVTPHMVRFGAQAVPRSQFIPWLMAHVGKESTPHTAGALVLPHTVFEG